MTRTELQNNQKYMWKALFVEERTTLTLAVEMLLRCHLSRTNPQQNNDGAGRLAAGFLRFLWQPLVYHLPP
jgi:hypothetical protein